ncbi:hypothetical protein JW948_18940 [bacterium]|nr:hypothetical protein [bacterium]
MHDEDVVLSKISIIKNCLKTIEKATALEPDILKSILTRHLPVFETFYTIMYKTGNGND